MFDKLKETIGGPEYRMMRQSAYERVAAELEAGIKNKGLWAKALADSNFNESNASKRYFEYRVKSVLDEISLTDSQAKFESNITNKNRHSEKAFGSPKRAKKGNTTIQRPWASFWIWLIILVAIFLATV